MCINRMLRAVVFGAAMIASAAALAQAPSSGREARATLIPTIISRAEALVILDTAMKYADDLKIVAGAVVVDQHGDLIAAQRSDGSSYRNMMFAQGKAFAAAVFGQTTEELGAVQKTRPDRYFGILNMYPGKVYLVGGGEPITLDGKVIGAVGVAGLPEGVDEKAGRAGIAAWEKFRATLKK